MRPHSGYIVQNSRLKTLHSSHRCRILYCLTIQSASGTQKGIIASPRTHWPSYFPFMTLMCPPSSPSILAAITPANAKIIPNAMFSTEMNTNGKGLLNCMYAMLSDCKLNCRWGAVIGASLKHFMAHCSWFLVTSNETAKGRRKDKCNWKHFNRTTAMVFKFASKLWTISPVWISRITER